MIDVPGVGDREPRPMSKQALAAVIEPRVEELFILVRNIVRESGYEDMVSSGIVLTGGTSMMPGMEELAEHVFLKPARIGSPEYRGHLHEVLRSPRYSTGLGLLMEGQAQLMRGRRSLQGGSFQGVVSRMKEWFTGNF
jgi:cell division protein FtsA